MAFKEYSKNLSFMHVELRPGSSTFSWPLANVFDLPTNTIAAIYKERSQVELLFKWLKQNLKIKSFLGTSKNAVMTQICIARITLLMIAYYKCMSKLSLSSRKY